VCVYTADSQSVAAISHFRSEVYGSFWNFLWKMPHTFENPTINFRRAVLTAYGHAPQISFPSELPFEQIDHTLSKCTNFVVSCLIC